jgi:hypothetical protein
LGSLQSIGASSIATAAVTTESAKASVTSSAPPAVPLNPEEVNNVKDFFEKFLSHVAVYMRKFSTALAKANAPGGDGSSTGGGSGGNKSPGPHSTSPRAPFALGSKDADQYVLIFFLQQLQFIWSSAQNNNSLCSMLIW